MSNPKADFLKECMSDVGQAPIDTFQKAFCTVCANRECARSAANNLSFDRRVLNWKKDLFDNVPRADEADPRFAQIRAKKFVSVDPSSPAAVSGPVRVDPPAPPPVGPSQEEQPAPAVHSPEPVLAPPEPVLARQEPPPAAGPPQGAPGLSNTPFAQGTVLPGYRPPAPEGKVDEIEPGGTFTFGGGEEEK